MDKFQKLRQDYPVFEYNSYKIKYNEWGVEVEYDFNIPGLTQFKPSWEFPYIREISENEKAIFENIIFNLGMVEVISYIKATCSPKLIVKAGFLNDNQIEWFKKLYINGLGEFFYVNNLVSEMNVNTFLDIEIQSKQKESKEYINDIILKGNLIPVGGGKDSALTLEVLKQLKQENTCYIVNPRGASYECSKIAGYDDQSIYCPKRCLDKKIIELNSKGFFNGHTPFSAILAFSSYASAILLGKRYIILSNEDSANEANVEGTNINHQYSKSIEFENDFKDYAKKYLCLNGPEYFSLLRPISEWQIVKGFVKEPKYFEIFKSCNVGSKEDIWCEKCPKCLYVYIMLAACLDDKYMNKIFKTNMLDNESLKDIFNGLVYPNYDKPFECVGTKEEVNLSLDMVYERYINVGEKLPKLMEEYEPNKNLKYRLEKMSSNWNDINNLPLNFEKLLKEYLL